MTVPPGPLTPTVAPNRFFTDPSGREWRVWLEPPARHQLRRGERRQVFTFVDMDDPGHQEELGELLARAGGADEPSGSELE